MNEHIKTSRKIPALAVALALALLLLAASVAAQEDKSQRPSPPAHAQCKFPDGKTITIDYSSPRMKGRKIFGGLQPYGQVWRAGANEATTFVNDVDLRAGSVQVPSGSYTLFVIPYQDRWTLIFSKKTGEWGIPYPEGSDLARVDMKVSQPPSPIENFSIDFNPSGSTCTLVMSWENARASLDLVAGK